jgi:hypothetical protein
MPYGVIIRQNIAAYLESNFDFTVENLASPSTRLYDFYDGRNRDSPNLKCDKPTAGSSRLDLLIKKVKRMVTVGDVPAAILFSAAGNDVVKERLAPLVNKNEHGNPILDLNAVDALVGGPLINGLMKCWLEKVLDRINTECVDKNKNPIPVFIHGYAFPVPDARYIGLFNPPSDEDSWLYSIFHDEGWEDRHQRPYPTDGVGAMKTLIQKLNTMQAGVAAARPRRVFHVDLTGKLSNQAADYKSDWENELHPTRAGFTALTQIFADSLVTNAPALNGNS